MRIYAFILLIISLLYYGGLYQKSDSLFIPYILYLFVFFVLIMDKLHRISSETVFYVIVFLFITVSCITMIFSPSPICDCFTTVKESGEFFLKGINPYSALFTQVYKNVYPDYFIHLPFSFVFVSPFIFLFGDPRVSSVFSLIIIAVVLKKLLSCKAQDFNIFIASFLFFPRSFYMIEHMYQELNILLFFVLFLYYLKSKKSKTAFFLFGLFYSFKQHLYILLPFILLNRDWNKSIFKNLFFFLLPLMLPFLYLLMNTKEFIHDVLFFTHINTFTNAIPLSKSLSLPSFLINIFPIKIYYAQIIGYLLFAISYILLLKKITKFIPGPQKKTKTKKIFYKPF